MQSKFTQNIISIYGKVGQTWLQNLPKLIHVLSGLWELSELYPLENLSYNYVLSGVRYNREIVLKISLRRDAMQREIEALEHYNGNSCIRLIDYNLEHGAILLEKVTPGIPLKSIIDQTPHEALHTACDIAKVLHEQPLRTSHQCISHISEWTQILDEAWPLLQHQRLLKAKQLRDELLESMAEVTVLHGDLHYENILQTEKGWIAIDPKGVVGEPAIDLWCLVRDNHELIEEAAKLMTIDSTRLAKWGYVMSIIACCWRIEDDLDIDPFIDYVKTFETALSLHL